MTRGVLDRVKEAPLTVDLFKELFELVAELPPEDRTDDIARSCAMLSFLISKRRSKGIMREF